MRFINLFQLGYIDPVEPMDRKIICTEPNGRWKPLLAPPALFRPNRESVDPPIFPRLLNANNVAFAPLRVTMAPFEASNNDCILPVLVSPPTYVDDEDSIHGSGRVCPILTFMEDMTPRHVGKQTSEVFIRQDFVSQKKQDMTQKRQKHYLSLPLSPVAVHVPETHQDSKCIEEAASVLFNLRYAPAIFPYKQPLPEVKELFLNNKIQLVPILPKRAPSEVPDAASVPLNPTSIPSAEFGSITATADDHIHMNKASLRIGLACDSLELNSLHCFVRSDLLELFVAGNGTKHSMNTHQVGIRCVHCARVEKTRDVATMASFFPKSLRDIYRSVGTWQRVHYRECEHIPKETRETYSKLKYNDPRRGRVQYWVSSARQLGLEDIGTTREGICFRPSSRTNRVSQKRRFRV